MRTGHAGLGWCATCDRRTMCELDSTVDMEAAIRSERVVVYADRIGRGLDLWTGTIDVSADLAERARHEGAGAD